MPAKSKNAHCFAVGDRAVVRDLKKLVDGGIVDSGIVVKFTAVRVTFESDLVGDYGHRPRYGFKRKGTRWVELKKDCYELEPA